MISGNPKEDFISFFVNNYLSGKKNLKLISFGSGSCSAEIELAKHGVFEEIVCVDIAKNRLDEAREIAKRHLSSFFRVKRRKIIDFNQAI